MPRASSFQLRQLLSNFTIWASRRDRDLTHRDIAAIGGSAADRFNAGYEAVTFDRTRITSVDWQTYPILRLGGVPDSIQVDIIPRPGHPFLGTGEGAQRPAPAALANAIRAAIGVRLYDLPFRPEKVKAAILGRTHDFGDTA